MADRPLIRVFDDPDALARGAADELTQRALAVTDAGDAFNVALSGGSTPDRLLRLLADEPYSTRISWTDVHLFWGDERAVPPDDPDSNFGAARDALITKVGIPAGNVHRIKGETEPQDAAAEYEMDLRRHFALDEGRLPRFDLVFLGMGADGHTASLFPGTDALAETRRLVTANWVAVLESHRITLTCPVFNHAACIMFLVAGAEKAETLRLVLEGPQGKYPAQLIRPASGELLWYVDRAAGTALSRENWEEE
jgi:6-phosphogluconolactonase